MLVSLILAKIIRHVLVIFSRQFLARWLKHITHKTHLSGILLKQTDIKLYSPFSDWFGTKRKFVWFQIYRKMVNSIWFWFDFTRFQKNFSVRDDYPHWPVNQLLCDLPGIYSFIYIYLFRVYLCIYSGYLIIAILVKWHISTG